MKNGWVREEKGWYCHADFGGITREKDGWWRWHSLDNKVTRHRTLNEAITASQQNAASDATRA